MWLVGLSRRSGWLARLPGFGVQFDLARRLSDLGCLHGIRRGAARARRLSRALMWRRQRAAIEKSGLFDREWYWKTYPDVAGVGQDALLHYLQFGGREGRSPGPDFDGRWYLETYADVAQSGANPLMHYIRHGRREGRHAGLHAKWAKEIAAIAESGLFDPDWYTRSYPDVRPSGYEPVVHYLEFGCREDRDPNPLFSSRWYRERYGDADHAGRHALLHYIHHGAAEGRDPGPRFSSAAYLRVHRQLATTGVEPLGHYLRHGWPHVPPPPGEVRQLVWSDEIAPAPPSGVLVRLPPQTSIDVIVPVFGNLEDVRRCLQSVLRSVNNIARRLIVVDDCSPDPDVCRYLDGLRSTGQLIVIRNVVNRGFAASVNRGIEASSTADVVLLNSDTEVPDGFLDRLAAHAYASDDVATVTPFSNNATICSWPNSNSTVLPRNLSFEQIDRACMQANAGLSFDLPTAVGFCMYVRRAALEAVGLFDAKVFGQGYGEECDFCQRVTNRGWRHVLAADTFVFHAGEKSFGERAKALKAQAERLMVARHPTYPKQVVQFVERDPARRARIAIWAQMLRTSRQSVTLHVSHRLGGGTQTFVDSLVRQSGGNQHNLMLSPLPASEGNGFAELCAYIGEERLQFVVKLSDSDEAVEMLRRFNVTRVHIHHLLGFDAGIKDVLLALDVPLYFTAHDYYAICPRIFLLTPENEYCGEPNVEGCAACLARSPRAASQDIVAWRQQHAWLFQESDTVFCPSGDVARRLKRYHPRANLKVAYHEDQAALRQCALERRPPKLRIAVLGAIGGHKGSARLLAVAQRAEASKLGVRFILVGALHAPGAVIPANLQVLGPYEDAALDALIDEIDPHVIFFPSPGPETYSYTLSRAMRSGRPIAAPDIGAFPERLRGIRHANLYPVNVDPQALLEILVRLAGQRDTTSTPAMGAYSLYVDPAHSLREVEWFDAELAARLATMGITRVADLLACDAAATAVGLSIPYGNVRDPQNRLGLMLVIPELRAHQAQLLCAAGFADVRSIAESDPGTMAAAILRFAATDAGRKILAESDPPDLLNIRAWISIAETSTAARSIEDRQLGTVSLPIVEAQTRYGKMAYLRGDDPIGVSLAMYGEWAQNEIDFILPLIAAGSVVVDIGANVGVHCVALSKHVGSTGSVIAFEPQSALFAILQQNLKQAGCTNVLAKCAGVGARSGEMMLPTVDYGRHCNFGAVALIERDCAAGDGEHVKIETLDDLDLPAADFIKIDAEGMEGEALAGMTRTVDRLRPVIFAECNTVDAGHAIQRALHGRGYRFYLIATGCYHAGNHRHEPRNCFGPACETSLLCLPEGVQCPTSSPRRWQVAEVETLHQLADGLLRVPRYGDRTSFSRDPEQLEGELLAALERIAIADQERTRIKADRLSA